jgi:2-amino-4-hydroxy-6-hydroxymethyldihydropteridine diphosphokinase
MNDHTVYLSIGSNLDPGNYLPKAILLLRRHGRIQAHSSAWESKPVGSEGPNFLNACVLFLTLLATDEIKTRIVRPIESALGRVRGPDKNTPRTIDIDPILIDGNALRLDQWESAFIVVPMAELAPALQHPISREPMLRAAARLSRSAWIQPRPEVLSLTWLDVPAH